MYYWYLHYQKFGELPIERRTWLCIDRTSSIKWTPLQTIVLKEIIEYNPHFFLRWKIRSISSMISWLSQNSQKYLDTLRRKLNYAQERAHYMYVLNLMVRNPNMILFIDDTAIIKTLPVWCGYWKGQMLNGK